MSLTKIVILVLGVIVFIVALSVKYGWKPTGIKIPTTTGLQRFWKEWWVSGRLLPILACFALIHLSIFKLAPKFWMAQAWGDWSSAGWFWGIQIAIGIAAVVKPEDKAKPAKYKFSTVAVFFLAITFVIHLTGWNLGDKIEEFRAKWGANSGDQTASILRRAAYTPTGTTKYPKGETWPDKVVAEKILAGQWDLLAACYRESGLKQFDSDGKVVVNKNKNGTTDTGICQINSVHDTELAKLSLDKNKLEDNLEFAKILYEREGLKPWQMKPGGQLVFEIDVTNQLSQKFKLPKGIIMGFEHKQPIYIAFNDESHVVKEIANELDLTPFTPIADYKFKSAADEKVVVTVTYDYK